MKENLAKMKSSFKSQLAFVVTHKIVNFLFVDKQLQIDTKNLLTDFSQV